MRMNPNTLKARIQDLEAECIILRSSNPELPTIVSYSLTQRGLELLIAIDALHQLLMRKEIEESMVSSENPECFGKSNARSLC
jgi:DNA-binding HxlR family transcriptional regulator